MSEYNYYGDQESVILDWKEGFAPVAHRGGRFSLLLTALQSLRKLRKWLPSMLLSGVMCQAGVVWDITSGWRATQRSGVGKLTAK